MGDLIRDSKKKIKTFAERSDFYVKQSQTVIFCYEPQFTERDSDPKEVLFMH